MGRSGTTGSTATRPRCAPPGRGGTTGSTATAVHLHRLTRAPLSRCTPRFDLALSVGFAELSIVWSSLSVCMGLPNACTALRGRGYHERSCVCIPVALRALLLGCESFSCDPPLLLSLVRLLGGGLPFALRCELPVHAICGICKSLLLLRERQFGPRRNHLLGWLQLLRYCALYSSWGLDLRCRHLGNSSMACWSRPSPNWLLRLRCWWRRRSWQMRKHLGSLLSNRRLVRRCLLRHCYC